MHLLAPFRAQIRERQENSPQSNTQSPNRLRLQTNCPTSPNPSLELNPTTQSRNVTIQMRRECIRRRVFVSQFRERGAFQVGEGFAHYHCHDDEADEREEVQPAAEEEGEDVV